ncbi:hypothetical protein JW926_12020, partial [Candidatus Sumerlaeota bacterium]|nr:hypothetical protein [Candidatus Sumerlaeota bacterium]
MIDKNNLEKSIQHLVDRLKYGGEIEENKIEIKREWYDLGSNKIEIISEFLKDITSIPNTVGTDGFLIIGLDKIGNIYDSPFKFSGL